MIGEKELTEYKALCAVLRELRSRFFERKEELKKLLEEAAVRRKEALELLVKANGLTRHLTGRQRQITGLSYHLGEIKTKLNLAKSFRNGLSDTFFLEDKNEIQRSIPEDCRNSSELKRNGLTVISMIDQVRKSLLQLDVLEMRCRELLASLNKALAAFRHESRRIHRSVYPLGFISIFYRFLRRVAGKTYFTFRELDGIADLGNITCLVLKIADSPLI
jgi:DNA repair exonuclease SbcCD ATPase subunit